MRSGGILSQIRLPGGTGDKKLVDLRACLGEILENDAATRAQEAVNVLRDVVAMRVWRQHPGTEQAGAEAARRLGVALPARTGGATWDQLRAQSVAAISAIREEVEQVSPIE